MDSQASSQRLVASVAGPAATSCKVAEGGEGAEGSLSGSPASSGGRNGRWCVGHEQRVSPDAVRKEAHERVVKLQQALEVLGRRLDPRWTV